MKVKSKSWLEARVVEGNVEKADVESLPHRALYRSYLYRESQNNLDT